MLAKITYFDAMNCIISSPISYVAAVLNFVVSITLKQCGKNFKHIHPKYCMKNKIVLILYFKNA